MAKVKAVKIKIKKNKVAKVKQPKVNFKTKSVGKVKFVTGKKVPRKNYAL